MTEEQKRGFYVIFATGFDLNHSISDHEGSRNFRVLEGMEPHRSNCPVNLMVEVVGDKWTLLILRDIMFYKRRHFNELLRQSEEGIASNILRDRLAMLEKEGMITKAKAPEDVHKQKVTYSLTEKSIDLLHIILAAIGWSVKYEPVDQVKYKSATILSNGGSEMIEGFRQQLLKEHAVSTN